ncbi:MAG: peptidylprolyl isomerase [Candidatus Binatia bacterium]|nr:peptidylprolyl isomerase [Candidatus Binatia bacterium]
MAEPGTRVVESDLSPPAELVIATPSSRRRIRWLSGLGMLGGVALTAFGLVAPQGGGERLPPDAVARVGGALISRAEYERTLQALASDRKSPLTPEDRALAVQRLIDEELLLQRALELELPRTDLRARRALVSAVIDSVVATQENVEVSEAELERFYEANRDWFTGPELLRVRQIWFPIAAPQEAAAVEGRARAIHQRILNGESFEALRAAAGQEESPPLPDALLPLSKLGELLGPTAVRVLADLPTGSVSAPVRSATGVHIFHVVERRQGEPPPFAEIRPQVANEFRRQAAEQALRTYLDELRARADVVVAPDVAADIRGQAR